MPHPIELKYKNLILIGCGPHYRKRYHSVLEEEGANISLLIDLKGQEETILEFFKDKKVQPEKTIFLDETYRNHITPDYIEALVAHLDLSHVDGCLICTEPKARKPYALFALRHQWPTFMDKPPTAYSSVADSDSLQPDFEEILAAAEKSGVPVVVSCERRAHFGYLWLLDYIKRFMEEENVPITSIQIHFANGHWVTPQEYIEQEHHPFKYGYGLLLHSGYHFIDLLTSLIALHEEEVEYDVKALSTDPEELLTGYNGRNISKLSSTKGYEEDLSGFGETSVSVIGKAKVRGRLLTHFSMQLENTSLSKRISDTPSVVANWRLRQEHVILHFGYLASIHVNCNPLKKLDKETYDVEDFNITIMHSPLLKGREPIIKKTRKDIVGTNPKNSLNQYARAWQLREFLRGREAHSSLVSHKNTVELLQMITRHINPLSYHKDVLEDKHRLYALHSLQSSL